MKIVDLIGRELSPGDVLVFTETKNHDFSVVKIEDNALTPTPGKVPSVKVQLQCNLFMEFPNQGQSGMIIPAYLVVKKEEASKGNA